MPVGLHPEGGGGMPGADAGGAAITGKLSSRADPAAGARTDGRADTAGEAQGGKSSSSSFARLMTDETAEDSERGAASDPSSSLSSEKALE